MRFIVMHKVDATREAGGLRVREWLSQSMIAAEAPGWRGATKAHTAVCN